MLYFLKHSHGLRLLFSGNPFFFKLDIFNLLLHHFSFFLSNFGLLYSLMIPILDLVSDHLFASHCSILLHPVSIFFLLERLETLNFHHDIHFLLLFDVFTLQDLGLLKLLISHSDNLRVEHHLVHLLNIVKLFIQEHLSSRQEAVCSLLLFNSEFTWWCFQLSHFIMHYELILTWLWGLSHGFLHGTHCLRLLKLLVRCLHNHWTLNPLKLIIGNDNSIALQARLCLASEVSQLMDRDDANIFETTFNCCASVAYI